MVLESWRLSRHVDIAESAAKFRAETGLRLPDAIQLASAVAINAFALVTHERDFSAVPGLRIIR